MLKQPDACSPCATRRTAEPVPGALGRYSLADGAQYRCSACDSWLCTACGDRLCEGPGATCGRCATPQVPQAPLRPPAPPPAARCERTLKSKSGRCQNAPTEWPEIPGEPVPVRACWTHLSEEERADCRRARSSRDAERARIWAAGEPERQARAAQLAAEQRLRLAACACAERLPHAAVPRTGYPAPSRCPGCGSWLCASCDRVRVPAEGGQCATCQPPDTDPPRAHGITEGAPHYRITVGGLENFTDAMGLLIRAGARNGGSNRTFAVDLPIVTSQEEALEALKVFDLGSDKGKIVVKLHPAGAEVAVDPSLPEPDLSGLGDIDSWWFANGYPSDK